MTVKKGQYLASLFHHVIYEIMGAGSRRVILRRLMSSRRTYLTPEQVEHMIISYQYSIYETFSEIEKVGK